jgi:hypothetical protein
MENSHHENKKKMEVLWEKEERAKHTALLSGIIFFMLLIVFLWAVNTKSFLELLNFNKKKSFNIDEFSVEFNQALGEVSDKLGSMKSEPVPEGYEPQVIGERTR